MFSSDWPQWFSTCAWIFNGEPGAKNNTFGVQWKMSWGGVFAHRIVNDRKSNCVKWTKVSLLNQDKKLKLTEKRHAKITFSFNDQLSQIDCHHASEHREGEEKNSSINKTSKTSNVRKKQQNKNVRWQLKEEILVSLTIENKLTRSSWKDRSVDYQW